jgi:DNA-binding transcriptional regulator YiaG
LAGAARLSPKYHLKGAHGRRGHGCQTQQGSKTVANVIALSKKSRAAIGVGQIRNEYGLLLTQAAQALGTLPRTLEIWEANPGMGPSPDYVRSKLEGFLIEHGPEAGKNLLFGVYPLRLARDILGFSVEQIAREHGYSKVGWQKFEANSRVLESSKIGALEERVRAHFVKACSADRS